MGTYQNLYNILNWKHKNDTAKFPIYAKFNNGILHWRDQKYLMIYRAFSGKNMLHKKR